MTRGDPKTILSAKLIRALPLLWKPMSPVKGTPQSTAHHTCSSLSWFYHSASEISGFDILILRRKVGDFNLEALGLGRMPSLGRLVL